LDLQLLYDKDLVPIMVLENNQKYSMQIDKGKHRFFVSSKNQYYFSSIIEVDIKDNKTYYVDLNPLNKTLLILNDENINLALNELNQKGCTQDVLDQFEFFEINFTDNNHNLGYDNYAFNNGMNTYNSYTTALEITCDYNSKLKNYKTSDIELINSINKLLNAILSKEGEEYLKENLTNMHKLDKVHNKFSKKNFWNNLGFQGKYFEFSKLPISENLKKYNGLNIISNPNNEDEKELIVDISKKFSSYNKDRKINIQIVINNLDSGIWIKRFDHPFNPFSWIANYSEGLAVVDLNVNYYDKKDKIASFNIVRYVNINGAPIDIIKKTRQDSEINSSSDWKWSFLSWLGIYPIQSDTIDFIKDYTIDDNFIINGN